MIETLFDANGLDETRVKRAFRWIITFRDFPEGSWQTVDGDSMMREALTLFTKGRAEFYLNGNRRGDRVPGILSSEHEFLGAGGVFKLVYVQPTTRLCIPAALNKQKLPTVKKHSFDAGQKFNSKSADKYLVCLGNVMVGDKVFSEESTFFTPEPRECVALTQCILLEFIDESPRQNIRS